MAMSITLASASAIRQTLLMNAGLEFDVIKPRVDEIALRDSMISDGCRPREIVDALAEMKALRISSKHPERLVIGCDQVLDLEGQLLSKPETLDIARRQLLSLRGKHHELLSAVVVCEAGAPIWRHIGRAQLSVRNFSEDWLDSYLDRNWPRISDSVGAYKLEEEGVRLFSRIDGDYFTILGLPLLDLLSFLTLRGDLQK
ncbi:Maf family protein [uncultured Roseovarius sp.]|uniref:Maf family protein n=1 Tax=uncultured Roseovarius sp. TaxID=293344 RepID=UPI00260E2A01|nr:Maf family protein [uncultured Roseovarius sp.]